MSRNKAAFSKGTPTHVSILLGANDFGFQKQLDKMAILGPANSLIYRMQDIYRKRIMIKFTNSKQLYPVLEKMSDFYNKKGNKVHVVCDFNPYNQI